MSLVVSRRRISRSALLGTAIAMVGREVAAQAFPSRLVRLIVPYAPGGGTDGTSRLIAEHLAPLLGQPVIVENRAGAGGAIGIEAMSRSQPDGYTIALVAPGNVTAGPLVRPSPYDPLSLAYITRTVYSPFLLIARPTLPAQSLAELVDLVKRAPDQIRFASAGVGTATHLSAELFNSRLGARMTHIPYRGTAPILADLIAGNVDIYFSDTSALPMAQDGRVRLLAVSSSTPWIEAPEVPPVATRIPAFDVLNWYGLAAPADTPAPVRDTLARAITEVLGKREVVEGLRRMGFQAGPMTPEAFTSFVRDEIRTWGSLIRSAGITAG